MGSSSRLVLILCSPRSCSSVACAMLGQHPQLYGFPELNLFVVDTIDELCRLGTEQSAVANSYITGLLRTVAQLELGEQTDATIVEARTWVSSRAHWTTAEMLDHLLARVNPKIGIDKSPRTALSTRSINRALSDRPGVKVIHLTRNPIATLQSMHDSHIHTAPGNPSSADSCWLFGFYARLWVHSQQVIADTVRQLGNQQATRIRAEDLLDQTGTHLARLLQWLELDDGQVSIEAMRHPERSPYASPAPLGLEGDGDAGFMRSPKLRPIPPHSTCLPPRWKVGVKLAAALDDLSNEFGYGTILQNETPRKLDDESNEHA